MSDDHATPEQVDRAPSDAAVMPDPEWRGDIRDPAVGCWYVINGNWNSPAFDADHCRRLCVPGTRYCEKHQKQSK